MFLKNKTKKGGINCLIHEAVAQLGEASPCQGEGRGIETRQPRSNSPVGELVQAVTPSR